MSQTLRQIQTQTAIPALSQSKYEDMGCEVLYVAKHIDGMRSDNAASRRGSEVHDILKTYIQGLVASKLRADVVFFAQLLETASQDAFDALENFGDRYEIDYDKVAGTEMRISLDADFKPCRHEDAVYEGTIDLLLMLSPKKAVIPDYKSYFSIIDADTFQSSFYPMLVMCAIESIEEVEFVLEFIRYGAARSVTYTRDDLPKLKRKAEAARARQLSLHGYNYPHSATPGRHCTFCPKLTHGCPVAQTNRYATMTPAERVSFGVWLKEATKENTEVLKGFVVEGGSVTCEDANGTKYEAGFKKQDRRSFPLNGAFRILNSYFELHPGDRAFSEKLTIGGMSSYLKAKMRAPLAAQMADVAKIKSITKFTIGDPDDEDEEE